MSGSAARVVVGRQSICRADGTVVAYELLFRGVSGEQTCPGAGVTGDAMTAEVVYGAQVIGLQQLADGCDLFVNGDRGLLLGEVPLLLPPERTVVEVLETVEVDADLLAGCRRLVDAGFRLALDDFVLTERTAPLLDVASVVKVDLLTSTPAQVEELVERCREHDVVLLAEKVESREDVPALVEQGFTLFQGYAFERPEVVTGTTLDADVGRVQAAAALLAGEEDDVDALHDVLRREPVLALQVLQLASLGRPGETRRSVRSLRDGIVLMGARRTRNWMALLVLRGHHSATSGASMAALVRARACELLADRIRCADRDIAFAAGLMSSLDLLLGVPLDSVRAQLTVPSALSDAAFDRAGPVGAVVAAVAGRQSGDVDRGVPVPVPVTAAVVDECLARALAWAVQVAYELAA